MEHLEGQGKTSPGGVRPGRRGFVRGREWVGAVTPRQWRARSPGPVAHPPGDPRDPVRARERCT